MGLQGPVEVLLFVCVCVGGVSLRVCKVSSSARCALSLQAQQAYFLSTVCITIGVLLCGVVP